MSVFRGLIAAKRGATAVLLAIMAPTLVMIAGFAVDYAYSSYLNQRLGEAADAAALAAVSVASGDMAGGYSNVAAMQLYGQRVFAANLADLNMSGVTTSVTVVPGGPTAQSVTATATYSYASPTFFSAVFGLNSIPLSGTVQTTAAPTTYINYYILIDNSQSMGIGQDQTAMTALYNRVAANNLLPWAPGMGCVFACHYLAPWQPADGVTFEDLAHLPQYGPYISLRIDAARQAVQSVVNSAQANAGTVGNIKVGLYLMNGYSSLAGTNPVVTALTAPTNDYTALLNTYIPQIELSDYNACACSDTDFAGQLTIFQSMLPASNGTGLTPSSPLNYVLLITDGLNDVQSTQTPNFSNEYGSAIDPSLCTPVKGVATVGVVYTTYNFGLGDGNDAQYEAVVAPSQNQIWPNLQSCASSPSLAFQASDGTSLITSLNQLFASTLQMSRLTQ